MGSAPSASVRCCTEHIGMARVRPPWARCVLPETWPCCVTLADNSVRENFAGNN